MNKKLFLILTVAVLAFGGIWLLLRQRPASNLKPNQPAVGGITIVFSQPVSKASLRVTDAQGQPVKQLDLAGKDSRYNVELPPGVYGLTVTSADNLFPPLESGAVTVTEQKLTQVSFEIPNSHD
jgi:hypothetical protein